MFNYIINIHNSEDHLIHILEGVKAVRGPGSRVYCVLDGCTDGSKAICDQFPEFNQIILNNVRETAAISAALQLVDQIGFNLILQDDVILRDPKTEEHIKMVYEKFPNVGVLGFRHGANFEPDVLTNGKMSSETDLIFSVHQPRGEKDPLLADGHVVEKQVVYKSPICISSEVVKKLGGYDRRFEPIAHDDTEYCIRAHMAGFKNYVCALDVLQPMKWGGTRRFPKTHSDNERMHENHMNLLRQLYPTELFDLAHNHPSGDQIQIWKTS